MSISDAQYLAWLKDKQAIRLILIEVYARVGGVETLRYLSNGHYVTGPADTPANQLYLPILGKEAGDTTETLALNSDSASMTVGAVEIQNENGTYDSWYSDIWVNRTITAVHGDPRWARADFRTVFSGKVSDIGSKSRDRISLTMCDKLQQLNAAVSEAKLGGSTANKDALIPDTFGEVHNVTPLLTDPATLEYQVHNGAVERIIEVRDNGIPVSATIHNSTGKFTLDQAPVGTITADVQGDKPSAYTNTISLTIQRLVTAYGKASDVFVSGDLDAVNLAAFNTAHPQPIGLYLSDRTNVLSACQQLAASVGAQITMSRLGKLQLVQLDLASLTSTFDIHPKHMVLRSLQPLTRTPVSAAVKLGYCKSWTPQAGLLTTLSAETKELFGIEWLTTTQVDSTTQTSYKLSVEPTQEDTLLVHLADADAEASRRLVFRKNPHTVYQFEGYAEMQQLVLGQHVTIYHPRFGLAGGGVGVVISLGVKWSNGHVTVGVLI